MRFTWRALIGVSISVALLWWVLRDVSIGEILDELSRANFFLLTLSVVAATAIFALRARRWQVILEPMRADVPFGAAWRATTIGMMVNNVIPARAGELARAYALTREVPSVRLPASIASLAVDRAFDALALLLLGAIALADPELPATAQIAGRSLASLAGGAAILVVAMLVTLYVLTAYPRALIRVFELATRRFAPGVAERGAHALKSFSHGLGALRSPARFTRVLVWTLAHWLLNALAFWLAFEAVGVDAPFTAALFVQALVAFGVAVPAAPGFFGVFEALAVIALGLYGVDRATATTFAVGFHVLTFIPVTLLGAMYATRLGFRLRELRAPPASA